MILFFLPWYYYSAIDTIIMHPARPKAGHRRRRWTARPGGGHSIFAMAMIRRIGHDHQAPFFFWDFKRWHEAKTSCHMIIIPRTPQIFTDSEPPIKWLIGVLIRGAPDPPYPPYGGAKVFFLGGYAWFTLESNIFGKLLTSNIILVILEEYPDPPIPYPPRPP